MPQERVPFDISHEPALIRLAQEARTNRISFVLRVDGEDVAVLTPAEPTKGRSRQAVTSEDALFGLLGIGSSGIPGGISGKKHGAVIRAKRSR